MRLETHTMSGYELPAFSAGYRTTDALFPGRDYMIEFRYIEHLPGSSLEGGLELLKSLEWHISYKQVGDTWWIWAGDQWVFKTDSRDTMEAFLYGMALSYAVLPDNILESIRQLVGE
jgi:hypothetical protein